MNSLIETIKSYFEKRKFDIVYHDRKRLTENERDQWIPEIKLKLKAIRKYFNEIIELCDVQQNSPLFNQAVMAIINPNSFKADSGCPDKTPAEKFFGEIRERVKEDGVKPIDEILLKFKDIQDTKQLKEFFNEVNMFCLSIATVNNKLLLYYVQAYPYMIEEKTGRTISTFPPQYEITTKPFDILVANIVGVAKATSDSILEWVRYSEKIKNQYWDLQINRLNVKNSKLALYINFSTVLLAIFLSVFFLVANDPFNLLKENRKLKRDNVELNKENIGLKQILNSLSSAERKPK